MGQIQNCINIANTGKAPLLWGTNPGVHLFICLYKFNSCAKKKRTNLSQKLNSFTQQNLKRLALFFAFSGQEF